MNRYKVSFILLAIGAVTILAADALFHFAASVAEDTKSGNTIWWFGDVLLSILLLGCFSLLPFGVMAFAVRLSRNRRYGALLITLVLFLMIPVTGLYFLEVVRGGKYGRRYGPDSFFTPGGEYIFLTTILHWFTAILTLVIAAISRVVEKDQSH